MSNSRLALVGAAGMKPRNRGLSAEITLGAITEVYTPSTSSGCAALADQTVEAVVQLVGGQHTLVQRNRVHPQPVLGVRQHAAHHLLGRLVDLVHALTPLRSSAWPVSYDIAEAGRAPELVARVRRTPCRSESDTTATATSVKPFVGSNAGINGRGITIQARPSAWRVGRGLPP